MRNGQIHVAGKLVARIAAHANINRGSIGSLLVFIPTQETIAVGQLALLGYSFTGYVEHLYGIRACAIFCSLNLNVSFAHTVAPSLIVGCILLIALKHRHDVRHIVGVHRIKIGRAKHSDLSAGRIERTGVF